MPSYWYNSHECKIKEDDNEEVAKQKEFNFKIAAAKKPYFMTYVYPRLKSENDTYIRNNNRGVIRRFNQYGINSIEDLEKYEDKTSAMNQYLDYYYKQMPVGTNPCVVNRISWVFERVFKNFLTKHSRYIREVNQPEFDYHILKSGVSYGKVTYRKVLELYKEYNRRVEEYQKRVRTEKVEKDSKWMERFQFVEFFKSECYKVCSNEDELCDIVLDICYAKEKSKQFAWDICGSVILQNLLKRNGNKIHYPKMVSDGGEFMYCGKQFIMCEKEIKEKSDDYSE